MSDLYDLQNEWYLKLKESGFKDIELSWAHEKHIVRVTLNAPHPAGKRTNKKFNLSGDTSILLERYAREFSTTKSELSIYEDVCNGMSLRKTANKHRVKQHKVIYLIRKAMKKIKADLKLPTLPEYLRCQDTLDFDKFLQEQSEEQYV